MRNGLFAAGENPAAVADSFDRKVARMTPEKAATRILSAVEHGRARVLVGADAHVVSGELRVLGGAYQNMVPSIARLLQRPPAGRTRFSARRRTTGHHQECGESGPEDRDGVAGEPGVVDP
jgi:hypothetical protein